MVAAGELLGVRHAVPELQRARVQRRGLAVGVHGLGGLRRAHAAPERPRLVAGRVVVVRDPGREVRAAVGRQPLGAPLQRAREREVQLGALARQQVVDHDLAQQRVAEGVAALLVGDHELRRDGLAHRVAQRPRVDARGLGEQLVVQPPARRQHAAAVSCASPDSRSIRSISASRSVGGSAPRPSVPAASSSSANSGLPSERANSRDADPRPAPPRGCR